MTGKAHLGNRLVFLGVATAGDVGRAFRQTGRRSPLAAVIGPLSGPRPASAGQALPPMLRRVDMRARPRMPLTGEPGEGVAAPVPEASGPRPVLPPRGDSGPRQLSGGFT